jgi:hypothetical protein
MIFGMILVALLLGAPSAFGADLSVCTLPDGQKVFTNKAQDAGNCEPYEPQSKLGYIYRKGGAPLPYIEAAIPERPDRTERVMPAQPNGEMSTLREMPFEVFRMLSLGMSDADVLSRAGPPSYIATFPNNGGFGQLAPTLSALRYYYLGDWVVVVSFDPSGHINNMERFRPRP